MLTNGLGLGVLFSKLQQGVMENRQILTIARLRAESEDTYGQRLGDIAPSADKIVGGFSRDDGATVRKVCFWRFPGTFTPHRKRNLMQAHRTDGMADNWELAAY